MVSTPAQEHPLSTAHARAHRSSAPAQRCTYAMQIVTRSWAASNVREFDRFLSDEGVDRFLRFGEFDVRFLRKTDRFLPARLEFTPPQ